MFVNTLLADTLSALMGLGSVAFYMAAFFYPEVHRRSDIAWSGLGVFYALILWLCAGQMTLAVLLGQIAVVALVGGLGWQVLTVRREKTPVYQQTPVVITPEVTENWVKNKVNQLRIAPAEPVPLKLEKRRLSEFSEERLGQRIDPRRRPAYEYEFVEDGILDGNDLELSAVDQLTLDLSAEDVPDAKAEYSAPPSAIAQIISVESETAKVAEPEQSESDPEIAAVEINDELTEKFAEEPFEAETQAVEAVEMKSSETATSEIAISETATSEIALDDTEVGDTEVSNTESTAAEEAIAAQPVAPEPEPIEPEPIESEPIESEPIESEPESDDWDDDIFEVAPSAKDPAAANQIRDQPIQPPQPKQKPSLLAAPLILLGWIKDVTTSVTKPKSSKPVIEIPRRDPSPRPAAPQPSSQAGSISTPAPPPIQEVDSLDENDNWEESNWDD